MNVSICKDNEHIDNDTNLFDECLHKGDEIIIERFNILRGLLKEIKKCKIRAAVQLKKKRLDSNIP